MCLMWWTGFEDGETLSFRVQFRVKISGRIRVRGLKIDNHSQFGTQLQLVYSQFEEEIGLDLYIDVM